MTTRCINKRSEVAIICDVWANDVVSMEAAEFHRLWSLKLRHSSSVLFCSIWRTDAPCCHQNGPYGGGGGVYESFCSGLQHHTRESTVSVFWQQNNSFTLELQCRESSVNNYMESKYLIIPEVNGIFRERQCSHFNAKIKKAMLQIHSLKTLNCVDF